MLNHRPLLVHFKFLKNAKLIELYLTMALTTFAFSLVGIFIPLYLLKELNYSFQAVMYFLLISAVFQIFIYPLVLKLSSWIGLNKTLILSVPLRIVYLVLLNSLEKHEISLTLIAFIGMLGAAMFWFPYHRRFIESSDHKHRGSELGLRYALSGFSAIFGPVLGGIVVTYSSFQVLFVIAVAVLILSILPLMFLKEERVGRRFRILDILRGKGYKDLLLYFAEGYRIYAYTIWAIYLFLVLGSYVAVGGITSGMSFISGLVQTFIGYLTDIFNKRTILRVGVLIDSITWFVRLTFMSLFSLASITLLSHGLASAVWYLPFSARYYDKMSGRKGVSHILFREWGLSLGKIMLFLVAMIFGLKVAVVSIGVVLFLMMLF